MNILTFDIEDWYNCDFISGDFDWDKHEVRIYQGVAGAAEASLTRRVPDDNGALLYFQAFIPPGGEGRPHRLVCCEGEPHE